MSKFVSCVAVKEGESRPLANSLSEHSYSCEYYRAVWEGVDEVWEGL